MTARPGRPAVLAVDGGNSKTDVALVDREGRLLGAVRGPTASHEALGLERSVRVLRELTDTTVRGAGLAPADRLADLGSFCLAGADFPGDVRRLTPAITAAGLGRRVIVRNDSFAALRAGTSRPWGVVLICGEGVNAAGIAPDRRTLKLAGIGGVSGDWGGGHGLGVSALGAAVRARDGRGPRTALERLVPAHFGLQQPIAVARAMRDDVLDERRASELTPILFSAATDGDAVARSIVDLLADELAIMAGAMIRRLNLVRRDVEVVLAGGVFRAEDRGFYERLAAGIRAVAPQARLVRLAALPVLGAALLGLDELRISRTDRARAEARLRRELGAWHPSAAAEPPEELTERGIG